MTTIHDAIFKNSLIPIKKTKLDSSICEKCYARLTVSYQKTIEYLCATIRKFGFANMALQDLSKCKTVGDSERAEHSFYSGITMLSASLDSIACLLNELYQLGINEKHVYFNNSLLKNKKLPKNLKDRIQPFWDLMEKKQFKNFRHAITHRSLFPNIPVSDTDPTSEKEGIKYFIVLKNPKESIFDERIITNLPSHITDAQGLLYSFVDLTENILREILLVISTQNI